MILFSFGPVILALAASAPVLGAFYGGWGLGYPLYEATKETKPFPNLAPGATTTFPTTTTSCATVTANATYVQPNATAVTNSAWISGTQVMGVALAAVAVPMVWLL